VNADDRHDDGRTRHDKTGRDGSVSRCGVGQQTSLRVDPDQVPRRIGEPEAATILDRGRRQVAQRGPERIPELNKSSMGIPLTGITLPRRGSRPPWWVVGAQRVREIGEHLGDREGRGFGAVRRAWVDAHIGHRQTSSTATC
jgi:hypothetical protein